MRGLEEGKITPLRYIGQLAKETIGLGAAQRAYDKASKSPTSDKIDVFQASAMGGITQVIAPMFSANLLSYPDSIKRNNIREYSRSEQMKIYGLALAAYALDIGIDAMAIIMAVNGNINAGIATKLGYNVATPVIADKIRPSLSRVVFQKKPNSL